jgi:hypothetical protein
MKAMRVAHQGFDEVVGVDAAGKLKAAGRRVHAGRQAIVERPVTQQRRHGIAAGDENRADEHGRFFGDDGVGQLDRGLRVRLVVLVDEIHRLPVDAALLVDLAFQHIQHRLRADAEKRSAARHRHDDVDLVRFGGQHGR